MEHILSMIGLAHKAGKVAIGEEPTGSAARAKHARVILTAQDAAAATVRRAFSFAETGACLCLDIPAGKEMLGRALGRTSCAMAAITDIGFAEAVVRKLAVLDPVHYGAAAETMKLKADRAAQRRREKLQHEKNLHNGRKMKQHNKPEEPEEGREQKTEKKPAARRRRRAAAPRRRETPRFAHSRPVKKGKGSVKKKKQ